eukprot:scaffold37341_cov51-Attheya_sp.AAC.6
MKHADGSTGSRICQENENEEIRQTFSQAIRVRNAPYHRKRKIGESEQYEKDFKTFGIVILLHFLKTKVPDRMFGTYLPRREIVYIMICKELFENMRDQYHQLQCPDPALTDDENLSRRAVEKSSNPFFMKVTYDLQMDLDEATEAKQHEATLAAYVKKSMIQAATSVTHMALDQQQALQGHPSLANNMETLMSSSSPRWCPNRDIIAYLI